MLHIALCGLLWPDLFRHCGCTIHDPFTEDRARSQSDVSHVLQYCVASCALRHFVCLMRWHISAARFILVEITHRISELLRYLLSSGRTLTFVTNSPYLWRSIMLQGSRHWMHHTSSTEEASCSERDCMTCSIKVNVIRWARRVACMSMRTEFRCRNQKEIDPLEKGIIARRIILKLILKVGLL